MRRVPDPESSRWAHMALYLRPKNSSVAGVWMEDYKFLAAYKLKATVSLLLASLYIPNDSCSGYPSVTNGTMM